MKSGQLPDAPPSIDATTRGTVRVTVLDPGGTGAAAVGANVVFIDPDGTLVKKASTDSAGKADADVLPGASVTAIIAVNTSFALQTVLAVKPGDDLVIGTKTVDSSAAGDYTVSFPANASATSYTVVSPCNSTSVGVPAGGPPPSVKISLFNSCKLDTMELLVVAQGANGPLSSISKPGVQFTAGGSTTISGSYQGLHNFTGSYTNIDPMISNLDMARSVPDAFGFEVDQAMASPPATTVLTLSGPVATGGIVTSGFSSTMGGSQIVRQAISGGAATYGLDVGATLLPWLRAPSYDAAANKVVVPVDMTGTSSAKPDLFRVVVSYRRTDTSNVTHTYSWILFGPEASDIVLPTLPADLGMIAPTATDTVSVPQARMFDADTVTGYDAIRNDVNAAFQLYTSARPPAATLRLSASPSLRAAL